MDKIMIWKKGKVCYHQMTMNEESKPRPKGSRMLPKQFAFELGWSVETDETGSSLFLSYLVTSVYKIQHIYHNHHVCM